MIKLKDLIIERPQSMRAYHTEILKKRINPIVADVLKKQNLPVVDTVTSKHGYPEDISQKYWKKKKVDKKFEWAVGWNKVKGIIQLYNRDTNSDTWKKYWKPKKPTRKLYFALSKKMMNSRFIDMRQDDGFIEYRDVINDENFMKSLGFKS